MAQWYVKDLSELTHISVQTLHHYDRINLLNPSVRLPNGYRLYSEKDLLKLQQIIALKFFGFELAQIKHLLTPDVNVLEHFQVQSQCLEEKAKSLLAASDALKQAITDSSGDKSIPWESIIKLIEVFRMTQQLEKTWAGKIFNSQELKEYANFEQELKSRYSEKELANVFQQWNDLMAEVNNNLNKDPASEFGLSVAKRCMDWVNNLYGKKYLRLRNSIWVKGFETGAVENENAPSPQCFAWLDAAITAYYRVRISAILGQIGKRPDAELAEQWRALTDEMHGDENDYNNSIIETILADPNTNATIKNWLTLHLK